MKEKNAGSSNTSFIDIEKIRALGNEDRLKILNILNSEGPLSWSELEQELQLNPNTLNFHLTKLIYSELIKRDIVENKKGRPSTRYTILQEGKTQLENMTKAIVKSKEIRK